VVVEAKDTGALCVRGAAFGVWAFELSDGLADQLDWPIGATGDRFVRHVDYAVFIGQDEKIHESEAGLRFIDDRGIEDLVEDFGEHGLKAGELFRSTNAFSRRFGRRLRSWLSRSSSANLRLVAEAVVVLV